MCELFGFSSAQPVDLRSALQVFYSHSTAHPHGWGYASLSGGSPRIYREPVAAYQSSELPGFLAALEPERTALAHIRLATVGALNRVNCHPFTSKDCSGRDWTLIHNGTIFSGLRLAPYFSRQEGSTDSERILLYLVDQIDRETRSAGHPLRPYERFRVVEEVTTALSWRNKLNLILWDGEQMYVHTNMRDTLFSRQTENSVCFATRPVDGGEWAPVPLTTLFVFRDGKLEFRGGNNRNEYEPGLEKLNVGDNFEI